MIAASEEFLNDIRPPVPGQIDRRWLRIAALEAAERICVLDGRLNGTFGMHAVVIGLAATVVSLAEASEGSRDYLCRRVCEDIDAGMPFVGWALGSEDRRIRGEANVGEGDFIKHLGRG